jgi:hypothetical protein
MGSEGVSGIEFFTSPAFRARQIVEDDARDVSFPQLISMYFFFLGLGPTEYPKNNHLINIITHTQKLLINLNVYKNLWS